MPVCEALVEQVGHGGQGALFREGRGIARAVLGDLAGAAEDFRAAVELGSTMPEDWLDKRREWLRRLEGGINPFDEKTRERLLGLPF